MATAPDLFSPEGQTFLRRLLASPLYTSGAEGEDIDPQVRIDSLIAASEGLPGMESFLTDSGLIPGGTSGGAVGGSLGGATGGARAPDITSPEGQQFLRNLFKTSLYTGEARGEDIDPQVRTESLATASEGLPSVESWLNSPGFQDYLKGQEGASGGTKNEGLLDPKMAPPEDQAVMEAIVDSFTTLNDVMMEATEKNRPFTEVLTEKLPEIEKKAAAKGAALDERYLAAQEGASGGARNSGGLMGPWYDEQRRKAGLSPEEPPDFSDYKTDLDQGLMAGWDDYKKRMLDSGMTIGEVYRSAGLEEPFIPLDNTEGGAGAGILPGKPTTQPDPITQPEAYQAWIDSPVGKRYLAAQATASGGVANNPLPSARDIPNPDMADYVKTTIGSGAEGMPREYWDAIEFLKNAGLLGAEGDGSGDLTWTAPDYPFWDDIQAGQQSLFDILSGTADIPYLNDLMADLEMDIRGREQGLEQSLVGRGIAGSTLGESERSVLATQNAGDRARTRLGALQSYLPLASNFYTGMTGQGTGLRNQSLNEFISLLNADEALKTGASSRTNQSMSALLGALGLSNPSLPLPNVNVPNVPSFGQNLGALGTNIVAGMIQNPNFNPWNALWGGGGGSGGGGGGGAVAPWSTPSGGPTM